MPTTLAIMPREVKTRTRPREKKRVLRCRYFFSRLIVYEINAGRTGRVSGEKKEMMPKRNETKRMR